MKNKNSVVLPGGSVRPVVARCILASGILGIVLALETHPCGPASDRGAEVLTLLGSISGECEPLEEGVIPKIKDRIVSFSEQFQSCTRNNLSYCAAVAVRNVDNIGNYCAMNNKGEWIVGKYDPHTAYMAGKYILLIVADPDAVEVCDTIELVAVA